MRITKVSYRRVRNLGNYESAAFEATAEINETEDVYLVFDELKKFVNTRTIHPYPEEAPDELESY